MHPALLRRGVHAPRRKLGRSHIEPARCRRLCVPHRQCERAPAVSAPAAGGHAAPPAPSGSGACAGAHCCGSADGSARIATALSRGYPSPALGAALGAGGEALRRCRDARRRGRGGCRPGLRAAGMPHCKAHGDSVRSPAPEGRICFRTRSTGCRGRCDRCWPPPASRGPRGWARLPRAGRRACPRRCVRGPRRCGAACAAAAGRLRTGPWPS
jgi:hypothetical protein